MNRSSFHGSADPPALAGDLGSGTSEVEVNVIRTVLAHEDSHGRGRRCRFHAVELDRPHRITRIRLDHVHGLDVAFHEGTGGDHLTHPQARWSVGSGAMIRGLGTDARGAHPSLCLFPAQLPERRIRHAGHGCEHHGSAQRERPELHRGVAVNFSVRLDTHSIRPFLNGRTPSHAASPRNRMIDSRCALGLASQVATQR